MHGLEKGRQGQRILKLTLRFLKRSHIRCQPWKEKEAARGLGVLLKIKTDRHQLPRLELFTEQGKNSITAKKHHLQTYVAKPKMTVRKSTREEGNWREREFLTEGGTGPRVLARKKGIANG